jgi:hypothetical protein
LRGGEPEQRRHWSVQFKAFFVLAHPFILPYLRTQGTDTRRLLKGKCIVFAVEGLRIAHGLG